MSNATVTVFEVLVDGIGDGPAGDGTFIRRFRTRKEAARFIVGKTCYGRTPTISESIVSRRLAQRWGV